MTNQLDAVAAAAAHAARHLRLTGSVSVPHPDDFASDAEPAPDHLVTQTLEQLGKLLGSDIGVVGSAFITYLRGDAEEMMGGSDVASREQLVAAAGYAVVEYALHRRAAEQAMTRAVLACDRTGGNR